MYFEFGEGRIESVIPKIKVVGRKCEQYAVKKPTVPGLPLYALLLMSGVARPQKPRHVCPENSVDLPSRKRADVEFAGVRPLHQGEFVWPDIIEIKELQQKYKSVTMTAS